MTGVLIQRGNMDTETDMHAGGPPGEHEGRDGAMGQGAVEQESLLAVRQKPVGRHGEAVPAPP